jgi:hypothetical protein
MSNLSSGGLRTSNPLPFVGLALIALLIALGVGWVILENLPLLMAYGVGGPAYFILLVILSLAAALVLFGVLRATASLTGSHFGYTIDLGGPAALFFLILLYGIRQYPSPPSDFALTFRFRPVNHGSIADAFGEENVKKATVILYLPKRTFTESLNRDGYAKIDNIPGRYSANPVDFNLSSNSFLVKDKKHTYQMPAGAEPVLTLDVIPIDFGQTKPEQTTDTPKVSRSATINSKITRVTSGGTSDGHSPACQGHSATACVTPQRGGRLVPGTGSVANEVRVGRAGWTVTTDTPEQICIQFWAATGACETEVSVQGQVTAVEEFPAP